MSLGPSGRSQRPHSVAAFRPLGLSDAPGLGGYPASRASIAMMECVRLIIGEERSGEREGQEVGRSIDPEQPGRP